MQVLIGSDQAHPVARAGTVGAPPSQCAGRASGPVELAPAAEGPAHLSPARSALKPIAGA